MFYEVGASLDFLKIKRCFDFIDLDPNWIRIRN